MTVAGHAIGPKCAKRIGLTWHNYLRFKPMILQKAQELETVTPDLFDEVEEV